MKPIVRWLDSQYSRHSHLVMTTADGREGFAIFGGFRARHRFGALYLPGPAASLRTRLIVHRPATAEDCRRLLARFGLVVFCGDSAPRELAPDLLPVPLSLDMEMPTPAVLEGPGARWGRSAKSNISRIRRGQFACDVSTDEAAVTEFHRRMYLPSMRGRHDAEAYVGRRRALLKYLREPGGELLRVFQNGQWVGATLNQPMTDDGYRLLVVGWLNGDDRFLRAGVVAATYWFSFQRAMALGRRRILLGGVAPHFEDGIFQYKSHWGARRSSKPRDLGSFHLLLDPSHPACRRFLQAYSTIVKAPGGELVVFSVRSPAETMASADVLKGIARWYLWREEPLAVPEVLADEVPRSLRPWVTALEPGAPSP